MFEKKNADENGTRAPGAPKKRLLLPNLLEVVSYQDRPRVLRVLRGELIEPTWGVRTTVKFLAESYK